MKHQLDYKMALYTLIIALAAVLLRKLIVPSIPATLSLSVAGILLFIGFILTLVEVKYNSDFFYGFAKNWNGYGIVNSGFLIGVANYFLAVNWAYGIGSALFLSVAVIAVRKGCRLVFAGGSKS